MDDEEKSLTVERVCYSYRDLFPNLSEIEGQNPAASRAKRTIVFQVLECLRNDEVLPSKRYMNTVA